MDATNRSQTDATSGAASATGLNAQNSISHVAQAGVQVHGQNQAPIDLTNSNKVTVADVGTSVSTSGEALAKGAPANLAAGAPLPAGATANGTPGPVATGPAGAQATSVAQSATGVTGDNVLQDTQVNNVALSGGRPGSATPVSVTFEQSASASTSGWAGASSAPACAGQSCSGTPAGAAGTAPTPAAGGAVPANVAVTNESVTQATTGAATAQGLEAQNGVTTSATANVRVGGNNYGAIQVVVDTITNIVNVGQAIAGSGTAGAQGGPATTQMQGGALRRAGRGRSPTAPRPRPAAATPAPPGPA